MTIRPEPPEARPMSSDEETSWKRRRGWRLAGLATLSVSLMAAGLLIFYGAGEEGLRLVIRNTARTSFVLFVAGFAAPALAALLPHRLTTGLRENQSYLFAAFAASHLLHAAAIFTLARQTGGASLEGRSPAEIASGGFVYLFIAVAAAPAFPRAARRFGSSASAHAVRTAGLYLIWLTFLNSYGGRVAEGELFYLPFAAVLFAALALRLLAPSPSRSAEPDGARAGSPTA